MLTGTGFREKTASTEWSYSINYGPEGEDHYANLVAPGGVYVSNIRTHHAKAIAEGMNALATKDAELEAARAEINRIRGLIEEAQRCFDGEPEYHDQGMGCGLEDRGITDRYDAMSHGWEQAMERVYGENIAWANDALASALKEKADG